NPSAIKPPAPTEQQTLQVTLPELGEGVTSGDLLNVLVKAGDRVGKDQSLLELETDKATIELPSPAAGTVSEVVVKKGDTLKVGQHILTLTGVASEKKDEPETPPEGAARAESAVMAKSAEPAQAAEEPPPRGSQAAEAGSERGTVVPMPSPARPGKRAPS